jgi:choline-sulfatase
MIRSTSRVSLPGAVLAALLAASCTAPSSARRDLLPLFPFASVGRDPVVIDFGTSSARGYLRTGWSVDERDASGVTTVWATGTRSVVDFYLATAGDLPLTFRCAPLTFPGAPPQTVSFTLNGVRASSIRLRSGMSDYELTLSGATTRVGWNRLVLGYAYARRPRDVLGLNDARELAVSWDFLRIGDHDAESGETPHVDQARQMLVVPEGGVVSYPLRIDDDSALELRDVVADRPGATLTVRLDADGKASEVVDTIARKGARRIRLPAKWAGIVRLSLEARGGTVSLLEPALITRPVPPAPPHAGAARRPNIVVYLVDTLRADRLGCYGGDGAAVSPNVDAFAREAIVFDDAVADSGWTRASVGSLFTGLRAHVHGAMGRADALSPEAPTIAAILREAGYETAGFVTNGNVAGLWGFDRGFDVYALMPGTLVPAPDGSVPPDITRAGFSPPASDTVNARVRQWLDQRTSSRPFFLYLHTADPHAPYDPPAKYRERVDAPTGPPDLGSVATLALLQDGTMVPNAALIEGLRRLYAAEIAENDERFGELVEDLRRRGLYEDALILFLSDHGEEFMEHGGWQHGRTLYREITWVPLILKLPAADGVHGVRVRRTVQLSDVLPTMIDYLGLQRPPHVGGTTLLAGLGNAANPRPVTAESHLDLDGITLDSAVDGRWQLIRDAVGDLALYDRAADPTERANVAVDRPVTVAYLVARLAESAATAPQFARMRPPPMDDKVRANLKALGYVQ